MCWSLSNQLCLGKKKNLLNWALMAHGVEMEWVVLFFVVVLSSYFFPVCSTSGS